MGDQTKSDCCLTKCGTHNKCFLYTSCWLSSLHQNSRSSNKTTQSCRRTVDATLHKRTRSTKNACDSITKAHWTADNLADRCNETISPCQPQQPKNSSASQSKPAPCNNSQRKLKEANGAAKTQLYSLGHVAL